VWGCDCETHLVVTLVGTTELGDESDEDQLADLGKLGVDDSDKGGEDGREREGGGLGADDVLAKQLGHDVLDVGHVDLAIVSATMMRSIRPSAQKDSRPVKIVTA
jgi:hypothetical protein